MSKQTINFDCDSKHGASDTAVVVRDFQTFFCTYSITIACSITPRIDSWQLLFIEYSNFQFRHPNSLTQFVDFTSVNIQKNTAKKSRKKYRIKYFVSYKAYCKTWTGLD